MASDMTSRELYARLLTYVRPYWKVFAIALLAMALSSLAEPVFPAMMKFLLDDGFSKSSGWDWLLYPMAVMGIFLARAIFGFVGDYAMSWVSSNVVAELRQAMFARMVRLPTRYYSDNLSGRLMSRIAYDVTGVAGAATNALTSLIKDYVVHYWPARLAALAELAVDADYAVSVVPFIAIVVRVFSKRLAQRCQAASRNRWARSPRCCRRPSKATRWSRFSAARNTRKTASTSPCASSAASPCGRPWRLGRAKSPLVQFFAALRRRHHHGRRAQAGIKRPNERSAALFLSLLPC
jgi:ABC-type multidrug transport system fused ATPase/permease subunit